jgi:hypothetical protein
MTVHEWQQVKRWGAAGHPAFTRFYGEYLFAKGCALEQVQHAVHKRALDESQLAYAGQLAYARAAEEIILDGRIGGERGAATNQTQVNVVINKDFDG